MSVLARELLHVPVPALGGLKPAQIQGDACPWCADLLDGAAIDLGRRSGSLMGIVLPWEPRADAACVRATVERELPVHADKCARCGRGDACDALRALHRLTLEAG